MGVRCAVFMDPISIDSVRVNRAGRRGWRQVGVVLLALTLLAFGLGPAPGAAQTPAIQIANDIITTVAGNGTAGYSGDGGPAVAAQMIPDAVAFDAAGNFYIADGNRVRKVDALTGIINKVAGNGLQGDSGDGGPATAAEFVASRIALDSHGNLYIADAFANRVREVDAATGIITTVAGNGTQGYSGDGGAATAATLNVPRGIDFDSAGNLYIVDSGNKVVREVDHSTGDIATVTGAGTASGLSDPDGIAVDTAGNLYVADMGTDSVRKVVLSTGVMTTVAGNGTPGYTGDGFAATSAQLDAPGDLAVDSAGNLYIADFNNVAIRKVNLATGIISTVTGGNLKLSTGDGGLASAANITSPSGIAVDSKGALYISTQYSVRRVGEALPAFPPTPVGSSSAAKNVVLQVNSPVTLTAAGVEDGFKDFTAGPLSGCSPEHPPERGHAVPDAADLPAYSAGRAHRAAAGNRQQPHPLPVPPARAGHCAAGSADAGHHHHCGRQRHHGLQR